METNNEYKGLLGCFPDTIGVHKVGVETVAWRFNWRQVNLLSTFEALASYEVKSVLGIVRFLFFFLWWVFILVLETVSA